MEEGDQTGNGRNKGERGKACMDIDKDKSRNPNCLLRILLFCCTGPTACFFMYLLKGPMCVCVCMGLCVCVFYIATNRSRITGYEKSGW